MNLWDTLRTIWDALHAELVQIAGTPVSAATILTLGFVLITTLAASRLGQRAVRRAFEFRGISDEGTLGVTTRLLHYLVLSSDSALGLRRLAST